MKPILYFLRSTEQKIASDMLFYAARLDESGKSLAEVPALGIYDKFYGDTDRDLGLYAISGHKVAGAAWIRLLREEDAPAAYVDAFTPVLCIGVKPEFRGQGIGAMMLDQLLIEAAALYAQICVSVVPDSAAHRLCERFGFLPVAGLQKQSLADGSALIVLRRELERKEVKRPTDGYDPTYWMD